MKAHLFRVGYFGVVGDASRGEGWVGPDAAWWSAALPATSQIFPRGSAADSGYWALRCHENQRFVAWVRNAVTGGRLHTTIACVHLAGEGTPGSAVSLACRLREATAAELVADREIGIEEPDASLRGGVPWFLALHSGAHLKPAGSVRQILTAATCLDTTALLAAAAICIEYDSRDANIAVLSTFPERPERVDFLAAGWNAIVAPDAGSAKLSEGLAFQELRPYSEPIRRRSVSEISQDVPSIMSQWRARSSFKIWQERLDIPLDWLLPQEMTSEEWDRRKETIRKELTGATLTRDFQQLKGAGHIDRVLDLAVIESECDKDPFVMGHIAREVLGLSEQEVQELAHMSGESR